MEYKKMDIGSFEVLKSNDTKLNIIKLKDVTLYPHPDNARDARLLHIKGKTFLSLFHYHYHHFVIDTVAQYEYIKKYVPDLNIEFMARESSHVWNNSNSKSNSPDDFKKYLKTKHFFSTKDVIDLGVEQHKYFEDIFDMYNKDCNKIIYSEYSDQIFFEEIYFTVDDFEFFSIKALKEVGLTENEIPWLSDEWTRSSGSKLFEDWEKVLWELEGIRCASKKIKQYLKKNNKSPKKIYISRQLANKRYLEEKAKLDFWAVDKNIKTRVFEKEDIIEKFFVKNGYTAVTLEGMPFLDQMNLFYNATHVASLSGSGLINMIGCDSSAKIIEIRAILSFGYCYHDYGRALGLNYKLVELRDNDQIKYILEEELDKIIDEI